MTGTEESRRGGVARVAGVVLNVWFGAWLAVGLVVMATGVELPFPGWGDLIFNALAAAVSVRGVAQVFGWRRTLATAAVVGVVAGFVEWLGATRGFLFGRYFYTEAFGPRLGGVLPLAIPCAWWVVMAGAVQAGAWLGGRRGPLVPSLLLVPPLLAVAVDLALEPVAAVVKGYWVWIDEGVWYGVPATNFAGWFVLALVLAVVVWLGLGAGREAAWRRVGPAPVLSLGAVVLTLLAANAGAGLVMAVLVSAANLVWIVPTAWVAWRAGLERRRVGREGPEDQPRSAGWRKDAQR